MIEVRRAGVLFLHRCIFRLALAAGNIFAWVVVFRVFFLSSKNLEISLAGVSALYALSHAITFLLTPLSGRALRYGVRRALILGTLVAAASFSFVALVFFNVSSHVQAFSLVAAFAILHGIYRALYWIPYRAAEAVSDYSPKILAGQALAALMPAVAGFAIMSLDNGLLAVFAAVAGAMFVSAFVVARLPETYEPFDWNYRETLRELTARANNLAVGLFILDGIQGATLLLVWPLAAFLIVGQSFPILGAILTATLCVAFLGRHLVRLLLHSLRLGRSPVVLATIVFSSWLFRLAAGTPVQLLAVDVVYNSGTSPRRYSIDIHSQEQSADGGHFVDEYTAIKEMGLAVGRIAVSLLFIVLLLTTAAPVAFAAAILAAAIAAAWSVFLAHRLQKVL